LRSRHPRTISPGPIATLLFSKLDMPKQAADAVAAGWVEGVTLKRIGRPEEIANLALFLASDEASFITGMECSRTVVSPSPDRTGRDIFANFSGTTLTGMQPEQAPKLTSYGCFIPSP
jgi:hypothetical protein